MKDVLDVLTYAKGLKEYMKEQEAEYKEMAKTEKDRNKWDFDQLMEVQYNAQARAMSMIIDYIQSGTLEVEHD